MVSTKKKFKKDKQRRTIIRAICVKGKKESGKQDGYGLDG